MLLLCSRPAFDPCSVLDLSWCLDYPSEMTVYEIVCAALDTKMQEHRNSAYILTTRMEVGHCIQRVHTILSVCEFLVTSSIQDVAPGIRVLYAQLVSTT